MIVEIVIYFTTSPMQTFSAVLRGWSIVGLAAPFGWGTLAGHFFHPVDSDKWHGIWNAMFKNINGAVVILITVAPIAILALIDLILALQSTPQTFSQWIGMGNAGWLSTFMLAFGFVWGALSWPV
ncbi:MAG: hypothetical protein AAF841_04025 [Pseudomonadota bacterium]